MDGVRARLEPFGSVTDEHKSAQLLALVANVNRDPKRWKRPFGHPTIPAAAGPRAEFDQASLRQSIDAAMAAFGGLRG